MIMHINREMTCHYDKNGAFTMSEEETCYICRRVINKKEETRRIEQETRAITVHLDCLRLFGELVRLSLQSTGPTMSPPSQPELASIPSLDRRTSSEADAVMEVLHWAAEYHSERGMTSNEIDTMFRQQYRWELSNAPSILGKLLVARRVRRRREGKSYRYYSVG